MRPTSEFPIVSCPSTGRGRAYPAPNRLGLAARHSVRARYRLRPRPRLSAQAFASQSVRYCAAPAQACNDMAPWKMSGARARLSDVEAELHDLMTRGLAGDAAAHRKLLEVLSGRFRVFYRNRLRGGDPADAEDLVQETLLAIHTRRDSYNPSQPVTAWVFAIARYKMIDHFRRTRTRGVSVPVDDVDNLFSDDRADACDPTHDVAALLQHLPAKQRTAIQLVKLDELSVREAAAKTGMSESDIKVSIHRGLKKLSALVAREQPS